MGLFCNFIGSYYETRVPNCILDTAYGEFVSHLKIYILRIIMDEIYEGETNSKHLIHFDLFL